MDKQLEKYLSGLGVKYKVHNHPAVFTVKESIKLKESIPGVHTKNLFLKDEKERFYLVCIKADKMLNMKQLKKHLSVKELDFGSPSELKANLNITPGSVSLFSIIYSDSVHLIIDKDIFDADICGFHPNVNTATLELTHENLKKFYDSLKNKKEVLEFE